MSAKHPATLVAHQQSISRIFSDEYVFSIPSYQRPYAWTTQQAGDLFDDLIGFMRSAQGEVETMPPYFLGSIVLIKSENVPDADVVDGQQRLTTLTLLLSALRANIAGSDSADITQLIYEKGSQIRGTQDRFRVSLRERDRDFFQKYVQREGGFRELVSLVDTLPDSQRNLRENAKLFQTRINALTEVDRTKLAQFIVRRCFLVVVATPDLEAAYRIFSVLNTRGLDLSATDILKAEIIGGILKGRRDQYTKKWEDAEEDLGRDAFDELFSHIRMVYRKAKPQGTLLAEFREHVTTQLTPENLIDTVLLPMAAVYEEITDSAYASVERAESVNACLKWLNRLEFSDWIPPALAFAVRHRTSPLEMESFFSDLERLAYAMLIMRSGVNERIERFSRLTRSIELDDDLYNSTSPLQLTAIEQFRTYAVLNGPLYESLSARARSTVLLRLDSLVSGGGATYDYETITVEHVLPQNPAPGSIWATWFSDPAIAAKHVHTLGNLALLTRKKNSAASNYEFDRKKEAYFSRGGVSPFALTTQVLNHREWTPTNIENRQRELVTVLDDHWRLQGREDPMAGLLDGAPEPGMDGDASLIRVDASWRDDVRDALKNLGGPQPLQKIYVEVEALRRKSGRSLPASLDAIVRRILEENSSDSESYKGVKDIFAMSAGKGAGLWQLR